MTTPSASELHRSYGFRTKKHFGQHFLTDPRILTEICEHGRVGEGTRVLEVGPGCGTLTTTMMARGADVTAIEIDEDAATFLEEVLVPHGLTLVRGDAMRTPIGDLVEEGAVAVANLPYNVAVDITFALLESNRFSRLTLMYQREVADRICAKEGEDAYGALSLMARLRADVHKVMGLPPGAFSPPPKVHSAVVVFEPVRGTRIPDEALRAEFQRIVKTVFEVRRKTMLNGLKRAGFAADVATEAMEKAGLEPSIRAERVGFESFLKLTENLMGKRLAPA